METPSTNRLSIVRIFGILAMLTVLSIILVAMPFGAKAREEKQVVSSANVVPPVNKDVHNSLPAATTTPGEFCNTTPIMIPGSGAANPYPSNIQVSGRNGYITNVTVRLNRLSHEFYSDVDMLLVGPEGQAVVLMSVIGSNCRMTADLTIQDGAPSLPRQSCPQSGGTYSPTSYSYGIYNFPTPAPPIYYDYDHTLSAFNGGDPNGTWSLYVVDHYGNLGGQITGGWCLDILTSDATPATTRTSTVTPTSTPATPPLTPTRTATGGLYACYANVVRALGSCTPSNSYHYQFVMDVYYDCSGNVSIPFSGDIYLEASPDINGPWTTLRQISHQQQTSSFQHNLIEGDIVEIIPQQFLWYRYRMDGVSGYSQHHVSGQTEPEYICSRTATATTTVSVTETQTNTPTGTITVLPSATITVAQTPTSCAIAFTDVPPDSTFYPFIRCLACRGIISGYSDGTFRSNNEITRGQIAKIVSNAAAFSEDPGAQIYEDVPASSPFYAWINRLSNRGHMGGYECGLVPEEPCIDPANLPYFRPSASATRGQLSKIVSNTAGLSDTPTDQFYMDVPLGNPFYLWVMRLTTVGVMNGYACGGPNEPCDSENRPYFRPYSNVTRGQASKIVANTFFPGCQSP